MNDPEFTPQEQDIISRLANAPQPKLESAAMEAIRARMLDAMDMPPAQPPRPVRPTWLRVPIIATAVVAVIAVASAAVLLTRTSIEPITPTYPATIAPSVTVVPPTTLPTTISTTETAPNVPTPSPIPEIIVASPELTPEATSTLEPMIVVEGPVQNITGNIITIYGIDITINPNDPVLTSIEVGDVVHVEADYATETTTIIAVTVEPVPASDSSTSGTSEDTEVNVNPSTGETWSDDGTCQNPPPPWAPANGWRRRCENAPANNNPPGNGNGNNGNGNGGGNGNGNGNGNGGGNGNGNGKKGDG